MIYFSSNHPTQGCGSGGSLMFPDSVVLFLCAYLVPPELLIGLPDIISQVEWIT